MFFISWGKLTCAIEILLDLGYGILVNHFLIVEGGVELYLYGSPTKKYYHSKAYHAIYDVLDIRQKAVAFKLRPILKLDLDEETFFRVSCGVNYLKLLTTGKYYINQDSKYGQVC